MKAYADGLVEKAFRMASQKNRRFVAELEAGQAQTVVFDNAIVTINKINGYYSYSVQFINHITKIRGMVDEV